MQRYRCYNATSETFVLPETGNSLSRKYFNGMVPQQDTICPVCADKSTEEIHKLAGCAACFYNAHCEHTIQCVYARRNWFVGSDELKKLFNKISFSLRVKDYYNYHPS